MTELQKIGQSKLKEVFQMFTPSQANIFEGKDITVKEAYQVALDDIDNERAFLRKTFLPSP